MSSKITTEKYDLVKMERLKHYLESNEERGKPRYYEIYVDNLKAVDKTNDPTCFDDYTMYMNEDSRILKVLIYSSTEASPRNDKFIFTISNTEEERRKEQKRSEELSGIEVQQKIESALHAERERQQMEALKEELKSKTEQLEEAEEHIDKLTQALEELNERKRSPRDIQLGTVAAIAIEEVVQRNPDWLKKIPLLGSLSGMLASDAPTEKSLEGTPKETDQTEPTASFIKKQDAANFDEQTLSKLNFFSHMEAVFSAEQLRKALEIMEALVNQPDQVNPTHELLIAAVAQEAAA